MIYIVTLFNQFIIFDLLNNFKIHFFYIYSELLLFENYFFFIITINFPHKKINLELIFPKVTSDHFSHRIKCYYKDLCKKKKIKKNYTLVFSEP